MATGRWRIGQLAGRVGVSPALLRAWEQRYDLFAPERSPGGFRLYTDADEARARRVLQLRDEGMSTAQAAALAQAEIAAPVAPAGPAPAPVAGLRDALLAALAEFDERRARAVLDRLLATVLPETAIREVVLPVLREVGRRWQAGELTVAQEHFVSNHLQARLLALGGGVDGGIGPLALLACAPGEQHAIGLVCAGLALRARGWRVVYLGADTPAEALGRTADELAPAVVVLSAVAAERFVDSEPELRALAERHPLAIGGAGASEAVAERLRARLLRGDPIEAAEELTAERRAAA